MPKSENPFKEVGLNPFAGMSRFGGFEQNPDPYLLEQLMKDNMVKDMLKDPVTIKTFMSSDQNLKGML